MRKIRWIRLFVLLTFPIWMFPVVIGILIKMFYKHIIYEIFLSIKEFVLDIWDWITELD